MARALGRRMLAVALAGVLASVQVVASPVAAAEPTFALDVSWTRPGSATVFRHPSKVRVGDTMTIGFLTSGFFRMGCGASIHATPSIASMGIGQGLADTGACAPWTFVVPPPPTLGTLEINGEAEGYRDAEDVDGVRLGPVRVNLTMEAGGTRRLFTTNFPHQSWAPIDFLGASTASFGVPLTFKAPTGGTRMCTYAFSGGWNNYMEVRPLDFDTCDPWQVTMPDLRPEPFRAGDLVTPMDSTFVTSGSAYDASIGRDLSGGMTTSLDWSPSAGAGTFSTNLPSITWPEATTPRYAIVGQPVKLVPRIDATPDGSYCRLSYSMPDTDPQDFIEIEQPVTGGGCAGVTVTPSTTGEIGVAIQLHRADREPMGHSGAVIHVIEPLPAPAVIAPGTVVEGDPVSVTGSVSSGVPMGYSISLAPSTTATAHGMTPLLAAGTCASGSLDPRLAETSASAKCTTGDAGSYRLSVRFTDVTGVARTTTRTVSVVDQVIRLSGADRYATAAAVSAKSFSPGVAVAYIATGTSFPDALAAGPVAARDRGPVLLTSPGSVPSATMNELKRLKPRKIVVIGGTSVIGQAVMSSLGSVAPVSRVAGSDRYETAAKLSRTFAPGVPIAYVAVGTNFPDALAGVPATRGRGPLLLVSPTRIPTSVATELARLKPRQIVVLGGTAVVSPGIFASLDAYTTGSVTRRAGADRYATAAAVSRGAFNSAKVAYVAVGTNFPDALAGGPAAAIAGAPMLLVTRDNVPTVVRSELDRLGVERVFVLGGTGTISSRVIAQLEGLLD